MQVQQYPQAGTQWVDSPSAAAQPPQPQPVQQDMVFQWVDSPAYRAPHQQHYLQPPVGTPYYQGGDPHAGFGPAADPRFGPVAPQGGLGGYAGSAGYDAQRIALDQAAAFQRSQYGQRPPHLGVHGLPMDDPYGQQGGYQLFEQPGARRTAGAYQGARQPGVGAARNPRSQMGAGAAQGRTTPSRTGADTRGGVGGGGGGARINDESSDRQLAGVLETLGGEGLRQTLISALESLYEDRIKPMANYVKGRLKEKSTPEPLVKSFVDLYSQHADLFIVQQPPPGSQADEVTIFFVKEPPWFKGWVDIDAPDDPYDEVTWTELAKFLDCEHSFAGGRYGMARELVHSNLPFLSHLSLGEVCHMVQLAIQHRRLIVYHRKMLKPIQTVLCQLSPANGMGAAAEGEEIKDMDDLCMVLFRMLIHHPQGIRLCRMKQMIKHEFCRKLSEMAFQCTKLIELFNQEPLAATFVLDTENDGKSIYVRLGKPETFSDHVRQIYTMATSAEAQQVRQTTHG